LRAVTGINDSKGAPLLAFVFLDLKHTLVTFSRITNFAERRRTALLSSVYRAIDHVAARQFGLTEIRIRAYNRLALREGFRKQRNN
jgi:hypothetical protein